MVFECKYTGNHDAGIIEENCNIILELKLVGMYIPIIIFMRFISYHMLIWV